MSRLATLLTPIYQQIYGYHKQFMLTELLKKTEGISFYLNNSWYVETYRDFHTPNLPTFSFCWEIVKVDGITGVFNWIGFRMQYNYIKYPVNRKCKRKQ
jgi:hypothetical protein